MGYPKINYIGNKRKIADWIVDSMPLRKGTVLDLFAGGCSMSYAFKKAGYKVISNDVLYSGYVISKAIIENNRTILEKNVLMREDFSERNNKIRELLENKIYFSNEMEELEWLIEKSKTLDGYRKAIFLALLRRAMIRKIPYSRMNVPWNQIVKLRDEKYSYKKYGRKRAYHNLSFIRHIADNIDEYNNAVFDNGQQCQSYNMDALDLAKVIKKVDIVYLDPPYPSTMNNYDSFYGIFDEIFDKRQEKHLDLTNKKTFLMNIEKVIKAFSGKTKYIILSQNTKTKPGLEEMTEMLSKYGKVKIKEKKHNYQLTGKGNKASSRELIYIVEM